MSKKIDVKPHLLKNYKEVVDRINFRNNQILEIKKAANALEELIFTPFMKEKLQDIDKTIITKCLERPKKKRGDLAPRWELVLRPSERQTDRKKDISTMISKVWSKELDNTMRVNTMNKIIKDAESSVVDHYMSETYVYLKSKTNIPSKWSQKISSTVVSQIDGDLVNRDNKAA